MKPFFAFSLFIASAALAGAAVSIPYSNTFDTDDGNFIETSDAQWVESSGAYVNTIASSGVASASTVQVSRPANTNFQMTTTFTVGQASGSFSFGFAALGSTAAATGATGGGNFYLADVSNLGAIRILKFSGTSNSVLVADTAATGAALGNLITTETYTMTLTGTYVGPTLSLALTVFDGTNTRTASVENIAVADTFAGEYFGFRNRNNSVTGVDYIANVADFAITVPEPSSMLLVGLGVAGAMVRRRRF